MDESNHSTIEADFQTSDQFAEADEFVAAAMRVIAEAHTNNEPGAPETCSLLLDLLEGARVPLRRLGGLQ